MTAVLIIFLILAVIGLVGGIITMVNDGDTGLAWFFGIIFGVCFVGSFALIGAMRSQPLEVLEYTVDQQVTVVNGDTTCVKYIINYVK